MTAIVELLQSGRIPRAVRATEQIETLVTDAIILIRPTAINTLGVYCDPGLRLAALRAARDTLNRAISEHLHTHWPANRTMKRSRRDSETMNDKTCRSTR